MIEYARLRLDFRGKAMLAVMGAAIAAGPFVVGLVDGLHVHAQLLDPANRGLPSFEVATIRPSRAETPGLVFRLSPTRFRVESAPLTALIRFAYNVKSDDQLPKEPSWTGSEKFDIDGKIEDSQVETMNRLLPEQKFEQYRLMVQSLLADRFGLKVSVVMKELPALALAVAKNGPKLVPVAVSPEPEMQHMPTLTGGSRGDLKAGAVSMALFAEWLSGKPETGGRVVIDATGLKGSYDFTLKWTPDELKIAQFNGADTAQGSANATTPESYKPSMLTALQEQLGLRLVPRKAPVEVLVIDHVERPSPN